MSRKKGRILPFRIPFFRIFYSTTYTTLFVLCLGLLAITPASLLYTAILKRAFLYVVMIGVVYVLTALLATFIYSSRLYTNRTVLAAVGKSYLPIEDGEVGKSVRELIVNQLERSAIVAWESRPRDLEWEILLAEKARGLPPETETLRNDDYTVGEIITMDPAVPPWGHVTHPGWSSPAHEPGNDMPGLHFDTALAELPNLVEARAVSLAPADPIMTPKDGQVVADAVVLEALRRPETMGMRDYLTQLSYLGIIKPPEGGQSFLLQYEHARFCGKPISEAEFHSLMASFAQLLDGMSEPTPEIIEQIRVQSADIDHVNTLDPYQAPSENGSAFASSTGTSPVTARTRPSRTTTPYLQPQGGFSLDSVSSVIHSGAPSPYVQQQPAQSMETLSSVIRRTPDELERAETPLPLRAGSSGSSGVQSPSLRSFASEAGSVLRQSVDPENGNG